MAYPKMQKGRDLMLFIKSGTTYHTIAYATNHTLTISADGIDCSNKDYGAWGKQLTSKISWEMTTENMYSIGGTGSTSGAQYTYDILFQKMVACEELTVRFGLKNEALSDETVSKSLEDTAQDDWTVGSPMYEGKVVITSLELNASDGEMASFSATFQGSGSIIKAED